MVVLRGVSSFLVVRYLVFGLFIICNAITCSAAVWNYSLVPNTQPQPFLSAQVDVYLVFLGAFSLLSIFALIFVELLSVNVLTTRVWFECAWVTLFWLMELAGGAALIAMESDMTCSSPATTLLLHTLCTSERVLLAFTWTCTIMLLVYLLALVFIALSRYGDDPKIWFCDVRALRAAAVRQYSSSTSDLPPTSRNTKRPSVDIYTSRVTRTPPVQTFPPPLVGISSNYEIEPFRPVFAVPEQMDTPHSSDLPEATPLSPAPVTPSLTKPVPPIPKETRNVRSLSLSRFDRPRELVSSEEYLRSGRRPGPVSGQSTSLPTPSPLGNWPRQDVMRLPAKPKRKAPPPSAFEFPDKRTPTERAPVSTETTSTVTQPRPRRPSGPRLRVPSGESGSRQAPLDLYSIRV